jgi:hypothetical protein
MMKKKNHSAELKARVIIRKKLTLAELAKKRGVQHGQISTAEVEKFHSKIGQLVVNGIFWPMPYVNFCGREAKNGKQRP